jgi:16S rRNA (cytosine967-C5)-methyltransferase
LSSHASAPIHVRALAARAVMAVIDQHQALDEASAHILSKLSIDTRDRAYMQALSFAALRFGFSYQHILNSLIAKSPHALVRALLLVAMADIHALKTQTFAAVHAAVEAARALKQAQAAGLVNAVLRRFIREQDALLASCPDSAMHGVPHWLWQKLVSQYPKRLDDWKQAHSVPAPMCLRLHPRISIESYLSTLPNDMEAEVIQGLPHALRMKSSATAALPGFAEGQITVQDGSPQLAAMLLAPQPGERILDACAAPGGKTAHLLQLQPDLNLTAVDQEPKRLELVAQSLKRLAPDASRIRLLAGDGAIIANETSGWDAILLDAPCSATGVIRRHPDIAWLRRESDIAKTVAEQQRLLQQCWKALRPGGRLLYATCSVLMEENQDQIAQFLSQNKDAHLRSWDERFDWFGAKLQQNLGRQHFPGDHGMDGFYYAMLDKAS